MSLPTRTEHLRDLTPLALPYQQQDEVNDQGKCPCCRDTIFQMIQTTCNRRFCYVCLRSWVTDFSDSCPSCPARLYAPDNYPMGIRRTRAATIAGTVPDLGEGTYVPGIGTYVTTIDGNRTLFPEPRDRANPDTDRIILDGHAVYYYVCDYIRSASVDNTRSIPDFWDEVLNRNARYTFSRRRGTSEFRYEHMSVRTYGRAVTHLDIPNHPMHILAHQVAIFFKTPGNGPIATSIVNRARSRAPVPEIWGREYDVRIDARTLVQLALPNTDHADLMELDGNADAVSE